MEYSITGMAIFGSLMLHWVIVMGMTWALSLIRKWYFYHPVDSQLTAGETSIPGKEGRKAQDEVLLNVEAWTHSKPKAQPASVFRDAPSTKMSNITIPEAAPGDAASPFARTVFSVFGSTLL